MMHDSVLGCCKKIKKSKYSLRANRWICYQLNLPTNSYDIATCVYIIYINSI
jgi:hypothetical protein